MKCADLMVSSVVQKCTHPLSQLEAECSTAVTQLKFNDFVPCSPLSQLKVEYSTAVTQLELDEFVSALQSAKRALDNSAVSCKICTICLFFFLMRWVGILNLI